MLSQDIQRSIAAIVVTAKLPQDMPFGTCLIRALHGKAVFDLCHVPARIVAGGMLYRVGKHRRRDTLRFCLPDNTGGFMAGNCAGTSGLKSATISSTSHRVTGWMPSSVHPHRRSGRDRSRSDGMADRTAALHWPDFPTKRKNITQC